MRLPARLFISYALVIAVGSAIAYVTIRLIAPTLFDNEWSMMGGFPAGIPRGMGPGGFGGPPPARLAARQRTCGRRSFPR